MSGASDEATDLQELAASIEAPALAIADGRDEQQLEDAAIQLRKHCLARSHRPADGALKSPCEGTTVLLPSDDRVRLGYERDLDVSALEDRGTPDFPTPEGWRTTRVLCRSGQAALSCLLHLVMSTKAGSGILRTFHAGRYFETSSLLDLWPRHLLPRLPADAAAVDLLVGEPVHCGGTFGVTLPSSLPRVRHALLLDTTLSGPQVDLSPWFARLDGPIAAVFRSGLKLDQAGLELANVGIVQLFARADAQPDSNFDIDHLADALRHVRGLTGTGLTLDELSALSVPWFLDRDHFERYTARIFAHNENLARAIGRDSPVFDGRCHPSLIERCAPAPFCAIRLRRGDLDAHRRLLARVDTEVARRGIVATKGGSFGFRGMRYELIEPEPQDGKPFLRVALGYRSGRSTEAMIELFAHLAKEHP